MSTLTNSKEGCPADPSFQRLFTCLQQIRQKLDLSREDDFRFLSNYFQSNDFRKLFKVHSTVSQSDDGASGAVVDHGTPGGTSDDGISKAVKGGKAVTLAQEVLESFPPNSLFNREVQELQHILTKPHVKALLFAHDSIAAGDFKSNTPEEEDSEMLLIDYHETPEKDDDGNIHPNSKCKKEEPGKEETKNTDDDDDNDDHDAGDGDGDDDDDDDDDDDGGGGDNDDDDGSSGNSDQAEIGDNESYSEIVEISSESTLQIDSPLSYPSLPDDKYIMVPEVHVDDSEVENVSADSPWWEVSIPDNEKATVQEPVNHQAPVNHHTGVTEIQGAEKAEKVALVANNDTTEKSRTDIKDSHSHMVNDVKDEKMKVDVKEKHEEKVIKGGYKRNDVKNGPKVGVPVAMAENSVRTVRLFRNAKETLGITVKVVNNGENAESVVVARILRGGLADTFGTLHTDDEILEINGRRVEGMTANEVAEMMDGITGSVDIKIVPLRKDRKLTRETKVSLRAFFDYNPLQDPLIPCKEVGVAFCTGEVLHVVNMDDAKWWQARKEGCSHDKTGLIPSKDFQEKRQQLNKISTLTDVGLQQDKNGRRALPFWRKKKMDSNKVLCNFLQDVKVDGWPAYEPVAKYLETSEKRRLLLLIGAPGVGRNELKKMLLLGNPDKFITTVPHTSRHMKSYETDGRDYFFVSRQTMENFIQKRKFIEFGEFKGCLYGTSKDSIKRALKTGKTCVLKVQPEVMLLLRTGEFKPYCIYIKPPPLKELRSSRLTVQGKAKPSSNKSYMRTFKEEDLQEMLSVSEELEESYGKFFDLTVVNKDTEEAYERIIEAVERLEKEAQWVPLDWIQKT